jgi:dienelactone hydrolase
VDGQAVSHARGDPPARRERVLFLAAVGVIAVHVIDDSFVQPQAGTAASDHLVSGLVPLAVLALAAWMYPRCRAGVRALIALTLGVFGIAAGAEAWHYTREVGASGDDFTGLPAIPAGLLLIGIGVVTLWRSRRLDEPRRRRYPRRALIGIAGALVLFELVLPVVFSYGYTHIARPVVPEPDLGAAHRDVTFETSDGLRLEGWYVRSRNGAAVIAFPGRKGPQRPARMLARHGYGVLLFDRRGEGDSEGDPNALGWDGEKDLRAAIGFLRRQPDVEPGRIGGIGLSVGGELLLQTAARTDALQAVVSEGAGIRSVREHLETDGLEKWAALPFWSAVTAATAVFGNTRPPANLDDLISEIAPRATYLIYAKRGQGGEQLNTTYHGSAGDPKILWQTDSGHTGGLEAQPVQYEGRVIGFFDRFLRPRRATAGR